MLVNLSPKPTFRTQGERWAKEYNRWRMSLSKEDRNDCEIEKKVALRFNDIFVPTGICGVYKSCYDADGINYNCRQHAMYGNKFFRKLKGIESVEERIKYTRNCWFYGVADNAEQVVEFYNRNEDGVFSGNHVIVFFDVYRDKRFPFSGWRWHKWGPYIGTKKPSKEYLNDEPEIDHVICFNIYKVV